MTTILMFRDSFDRLRGLKQEVQLYMYSEHLVQRCVPFCHPINEVKVKTNSRVTLLRAVSQFAI